MMDLDAMERLATEWGASAVLALIQRLREAEADLHLSNRMALEEQAVSSRRIGALEQERDDALARISQLARHTQHCSPCLGRSRDDVSDHLAWLVVQIRKAAGWATSESKAQSETSSVSAPDTAPKAGRPS